MWAAFSLPFLTLSRTSTSYSLNSYHSLSILFLQSKPMGLSFLRAIFLFFLLCFGFLRLLLSTVTLPQLSLVLLLHYVLVIFVRRAFTPIVGRDLLARLSREIFLLCTLFSRKNVCESEEIGIVIGFLNGSPHLEIHGFNIYHRYRLIMPFWRVVHKCKGVVGVLQVDCLKPTHDKQDFKKSGIFLKLELRLKCMALEYWKYHCHLIGLSDKIPSSSQLPYGYQLYNQETNKNVQEAFPKRRKRALEAEITDVSESLSGFTNLNGESSQAVLPQNKNYGENIDATEELKQQSVNGGISPARKTKPQIQIQHVRSDRKQAFITMLQRRKQLNEQCMELEKSVEELTHKEKRLRSELEIVQLVYNDLYAGLKSVGKMDR